MYEMVCSSGYRRNKVIVSWGSEDTGFVEKVSGPVEKDEVVWKRCRVNCNGGKIDGESISGGLEDDSVLSNRTVPVRRLTEKAAQEQEQRTRGTRVCWRQNWS